MVYRGKSGINMQMMTSHTSAHLRSKLRDNCFEEVIVSQSLALYGLHVVFYIHHRIKALHARVVKNHDGELWDRYT